MRILALNWNDLKNPYAGGAEVHLEELLRRLVRAGHQVTLFCSGFTGCPPEETVEGIRIVRRGNRYNFNLIAPWHLRRLVKNGRFDVLVEDVNKIPFYTPLFLNLRTLVVVPHLFATTVFQEINFVLGTYIYLAERPMIYFYRGLPFNVISESTADDLVARGVPRRDISVIHCGINRDLYAPDPNVARYDQPTVLYLGRIKKYKSIHHLIQAFGYVKREVPRARLMIVGDGDYVGPLKSLTQSLGLADDVEFPGYVPTADKVLRMRRSHVAVLPSLKEGWGLTNIEANSVGTPVIAADAPGLRDSVRDGETGFLYPHGDVGNLARKIISVLADDALHARLAEGALKWAERFSWDNAAVQFEMLLRRVVEGDR